MSSPPSSDSKPEADVASWLGWLDVAGSEREVVRICRDFVATLDAEALRKLPERCRPHDLGNASDLCALAYELVRHQCGAGAASPIALRLASVFARANVRIAYIYRRMNDREMRAVWRER